MKAGILALAVLSVVTLASCKKDYVCECTKVRTDSEGNRNSSADGNYTFKESRIRAEKKCDDQEGTGSDVVGDYARQCDVQ